MSKTSTYPLRLPASLKAAAEKLSKDDGTSLNQSVVMTVAEKMAALQTATFFDDRQRGGPEGVSEDPEA